MKIFIYHIVAVILLVSISGNNQVFAQEPSVKNILENTRRLSDQGQFDSARQIVERGLQESPDNYSLKMQLIRIFGWSGDYTTALKHLEAISQTFPVNQEMLDLNINLYYWSAQHDSLLHFCNKYLKKYGNQPDILYKKAVALNNLGNDEESLNTLNTLINAYPDHEKAKELRINLLVESTSNSLYFEYFHSIFNNGQDPWQTGRLGYAKDYTKGTIALAVSTGKMYDLFYQQVDAEWYQQIRDNWRMMAYGQYTFNPVTLKQGFGTDFYYQIIKDLEIGAGGRYLAYTDNDVWSISGMANKYFGNYFISLRSNLYLVSGEKINYGGVLSGRKYFDTQQWLGLTLNYGYLIYEPAQSENFYRQNSGGLYCSGNVRISGNHFLRSRAGIQREPVVEQGERLRYFISIGYWVRF